MADDAKDKDKDDSDSESSGLADILEVSEKVGNAGDSFAGIGITAGDDDDDDDDDDDLANFGAAASASLIADGDDDDLLPPAPPPAPAAPAKAATKPPPPPPAKTTPPAAPSKTPEKSAAAAITPTSSAAAASVMVDPDEDSDSGASEAALLVASAPKAVPAAVPAANDDEGGSKWWMIALGLVAVAGVAWFAFFRDKGETTEKAPVAEAKPEPTEIAQAEPEPEPEPEPAIVEGGSSTGEATGSGTDSGSDSGGSDSGGEEAVAEPSNGKGDDWDATRKAKGIKKKSDGPPPPEPPGPPPPPPPDEPKASPDPFKTDGKYSAECVLDPNKPGCEEYRRKQAAKLKDLDAHLSDKLSKAQIRDGINKVKGKAKACGATHGADADTTVRIKLSIEGETGSVTSAEAQAPHAGTPLGDCVADALKGAKFDRFTSAVQGTTYPVTF